MEKFDALVVGAGAIGASTAYHLARDGLEVAVVEKEVGPAMHQSGRNSGVIHAGYNLKPGTVKAKYCVEGNRQLRQYCAERGVPVRKDGILIVAGTEAELSIISELERRGLANDTEVRVVNRHEINDIEPHAKGIGALQALEGASVDARAYVQALTSDAAMAGVKLLYDRRVRSLSEEGNLVVAHTDKGSVGAKVAINAAGLYADKLAGNMAKDVRVVPFRGYYAELKPEKSHLINSHVYAAPDLNFPFLGIHLSKRTDGRVIVGPGAMIAFGREAYRFGGFEGGGLDTFTWPGFYKMVTKPEFRMLIRSEIKKSLVIKAIGREAMRLIPELSETDIVRSYSGNRAQLVDRDGNLVDDILVRESERTLHVLNAVSPGLTCSLPFGRSLAEQAKEKI